MPATSPTVEHQTTSSETEACLVQTSIGRVQGFTSPQFPHVRQWLGIPFAEPPTGPLRFAAPVAKRPLSDNEILSAMQMPLAPIQAFSTRSDFYSKYVPEYLATGPYSEDCLYLNVFAPLKHQEGEDLLPTLVFFYGGEGEWGGINAQYSQPQGWVESSGKHIVVLFNYRVGVFGFPNAGSQCDAPLGILDQRMALEFLRTNIHAFDGSPDGIAAFGHAAGGASIEAHLFAWPSDPIIATAICISGFLPQIGARSLLADNSFSRLARKLGCPDDVSVDEQIAYLRGVDAGAIVGCWRACNDAIAEEQKFYFPPAADGVHIFPLAEQLKRAQAGEYAKVPMLLGMTTNEGVALVDPLKLDAGDPAAITAAAKWNARFEAAVQQVIQYRLASNAPTYRWLYAGEFANIAPRPWMKAYHFSELPMLMGTHSLERGPSTPFQQKLSSTMQSMWVDFASDPHHGLDKWDWQPAQSGEDGPMVLGRDGISSQQLRGRGAGNDGGKRATGGEDHANGGGKHANGGGEQVNGGDNHTNGSTRRNAVLRDVQVKKSGANDGLPTTTRRTSRLARYTRKALRLPDRSGKA